jgi:hypothetical protein
MNAFLSNSLQLDTLCAISAGSTIRWRRRHRRAGRPIPETPAIPDSNREARAVTYHEAQWSGARVLAHRIWHLRSPISDPSRTSSAKCAPPLSNRYPVPTDIRVVHAHLAILDIAQRVIDTDTTL